MIVIDITGGIRLHTDEIFTLIHVKLEYENANLEAMKCLKSQT